MHSIGTSDIARKLMLQNRSGSLKTELNRLTSELSSGRVSKRQIAENGQQGYLNDMTARQNRLAAFKIATSEASHLATGMQTALERMQNVSSELGKALILSQTISTGTGQGQSVSEQSRQTLDSLISSLNTKIGGRSVFSGNATDTSPLSTADDLLNALSAGISGAATPDDMITAAQTWFDDPLGFGAEFQGSTDYLAPLSLSDDQSVSLNLKADDPEIKALVMNAALAGLADDAAFGLSDLQQNELHAKLGAKMLADEGSLTYMRGQLGYSEVRIEQISAQNSAETTAVNIAVSNLVSIDPYQTATDLESVQFQLQALFSITSRMSQLSLVNYL